MDAQKLHSDVVMMSIRLGNLLKKTLVVQLVNLDVVKMVKKTKHQKMMIV